jgi:predicted flap endonuclease-1-like 5' DNA nuclease
MSSSVSSYPISHIDGLGSHAQTRLKAQGIRTTAGLLENASTVKARKALAAKTGLSEQDLLAWANIADCMRIKGMGKAKAELLRAAGVVTVREFALRNPERLAQAMREANGKRKLVRVLPSDKSVAELIQRARKLPLKISY